MIYKNNINNLIFFGFSFIILYHWCDGISKNTSGKLSTVSVVLIIPMEELEFESYLRREAFNSLNGPTWDDLD